jgi:hypothetical protein
VKRRNRSKFRAAAGFACLCWLSGDAWALDLNLQKIGAYGNSAPISAVSAAAHPGKRRPPEGGSLFFSKDSIERGGGEGLPLTIRISSENKATKSEAPPR